MRLNPEFFNDEPKPDPEPMGLDPEIEAALDDMFRVVHTLDDLPDEKKAEIDLLTERIKEIIEHEGIVNPDKDSLIRYIAFQGMQISGLQTELSKIHKMLLMLAKAVDTKEDRKDGHVG
jgi:hypothetical protein